MNAATIPVACCLEDSFGMSPAFLDLPDPLIDAIHRAAKEVKRRADRQGEVFSEDRLPGAIEDYEDDILVEITRAWRAIEENRFNSVV